MTEFALSALPPLAVVTELSASAIAASAAVVVATLAFLGRWRETELTRKRQTCAEAMADAIAWIELPYRVRRRQDDEPLTLDALAERFHTLHERLLFHENWLRVELPTAYQLYVDLVEAARRAAFVAIREAWEADPVSTPVGMNISADDLGIDRTEVSGAAAAFTIEVRNRLSLVRLPW